jgi:hypothetical protein
MNLDLMSDLYMAAVCAVVVVGWFAREIAAEIRVGRLLGLGDHLKMVRG